jgi:hypothetical protein
MMMQAYGALAVVLLRLLRARAADEFFIRQCDDSRRRGDLTQEAGRICLTIVPFSCDAMLGKGGIARHAISP